MEYSSSRRQNDGTCRRSSSTSSETYDARHSLDAHFRFRRARKVAETLIPPPPQPSFCVSFHSAPLPRCTPALVLSTLILFSYSSLSVCLSVYLFSASPISFPQPLPPQNSRAVFLQMLTRRNPVPRTLERPAQGRVNRVWRRPGSLVAGWVPSEEGRASASWEARNIN